MHLSDVQTFLQGRTGGRWLLTPSSWPQLLSFGNALLGVASANDQARGATRIEIFAKYKTLLLGNPHAGPFCWVSRDFVRSALLSVDYSCSILLPAFSFHRCYFCLYLCSLLRGPNGTSIDPKKL